ncbi:MAG: flagellar motor protein MotB [Pseudomonadota bacterium]
MDGERPIIIKKITKGGGDGHHGGAWKVAYADFVTAMMAFFLLMWLLNATSEEQRKGLADYFDPAIPISRNSAGGAGMLAGDSAFSEDTAAGTATEGIRAKPSTKVPGQNVGDLDKVPDIEAEEDAASTTPSELGADGNPAQAPAGADGEVSDEALAEAAAKRQQEFAEVAEDLQAQIEAAGQDGLLQHFSMRMTPEGLVIEIGDLRGDPLFGSGEAGAEPVLQELIDILVPVLSQTTNDLAVVGHTDSKPFTSRRRYSNWELSADRANTARRMLMASGLREERIVRVSGRAATDPVSPDPEAPRNRRIAITLLRSGL